jgi:FAD synthetase
MNGKIITTREIIELSKKLNGEKKKIVLVGGCFDILHAGHIEFLTAAKKSGDVLFVLLESDENIKKLKGANRPLNSQRDRAKILENLEMIDYVVALPPLGSNKEYDELVSSLKPAIIAVTKGDPGLTHKKRQANLIGAEIAEVAEQVINQSTTKLIKILKEI